MTSPNDLSSFWMPFTANRAFKENPKFFASADGIYYRTPEGREVMDGTSGLWCCNVGHNNPRIVAAIQTQAARLDYAPPFQLAHEAAFELSARLAAMAPEGFSQVFYGNSGSEAVDTALKIALGYHRVRGEGSRTRLIGRERGYHGVGFGGTSVGGIVGNRRMFGHLLAGVDHIRHTYQPELGRFIDGMPAQGAELADDLQRLVNLHDASTIAAVIVEPIACSTGVLVPPVGYLERLREITSRYGILLIFDEVITAFGRVGAPFAAERFGVTPDIITFAKGVTNGSVPMGGALVRSDIYEAIVSATPKGGIEFAHGYTYSAHPLACAAALATLDVYEEDGLFDRVRALEPYWAAKLHSLKGCPHVADLRNFGLIGAIELESRDGAPGARGTDFFQRCFERDLLVRNTGDIIALSPPFIVEPAQIDHIMDVASQVLGEMA